MGSGFNTLTCLFFADMLMSAAKVRKENSKDSTTFTYIFKSGASNKYKIGKTRNGVENRRKALSGMNPEELSLVLTLEKDVETEIHRKYASKRLHGEWFELSEKDLCELQNIPT